MSKLKSFVVLYRIESVMLPIDSPFGFICDAESIDHAEEQCFNAYPDCGIVWVYMGNNLSSAYDEYYYIDFLES